MTYEEPERLALRLQALLERRAVVRAALERALGDVLTDAERDDLRVALDSIDQEADALARRLDSLRAGPGGGGTG